MGSGDKRGQTQNIKIGGTKGVSPIFDVFSPGDPEKTGTEKGGFHVIFEAKKLRVSAPACEPLPRTLF